MFHRVSCRVDDNNTVSNIYNKIDSEDNILFPSEELLKKADMYPKQKGYI